MYKNGNYLLFSCCRHVEILKDAYLNICALDSVLPRITQFYFTLGSFSPKIFRLVPQNILENLIEKIQAIFPVFLLPVVVLPKNFRLPNVYRPDPN